MVKLLKKVLLERPKEETNTEVKMGNLYAIFNIPQINQVYMLHLAEVINEDYSSTSESLEVKFLLKRYSMG